ncbi:MAG: winged helix-turn-helix transcriptional regulator [Candidatus Woesearchaeota archaeon]
MSNRNIGFMLIGLSALLGIGMFSLIGQLNTRSADMDCISTPQCQSIISTMNTSHIFVGILASIFSLGVYMLLFNRTEEAILQRLEETKKEEIQETKFDLIARALDENERKVLEAVKEQNGITQNTLKLKTNLSKAKVSQVLSSFERKGLIKREKDGKTYSVYLIQQI